MKLFQRTLLSFFGIIMVQGALTIALVADRIANSQSEDAWRELRSEALIVYDNVNSWKRLLWKEAVDLHEDEELSAIIGLQRSIAFDSLLRSYLSIVSERSGADFLIIRSSGSHFNISMNLSGKNLPIPPERFFLNTRNHPYIDTIVLEQTLYFVGTTRCTADNGNAIDIFLIKRLDEALCSQLTFNPRIRSILSIDSKFSVGSISGGALLAWLSGRPMLNSYSTIDSIAQDGVPYSAIIQQSGIARYIDSDSRMTEEDLYITTLFSRFENQQRLASINRIVITVSLVIAAFTLLISFGLARTITSPIRKLRDAMHSVKAGNFEMILEDTLKGEMGELLQGFNEMASQLAEDRLSQDKYIAEIIRLKEYDERVFNSIREGLVVVNAVFNIEKANHAFLQYFNLTIEDVTGRNIDELSIGLFDESLHVDIRAIVSGELNEEVQVRRTPSGISYEIKLYSLYEASRPKNDRIHCILIIENISRRIAYEEGIFQAEKLAGISMLSAGLAHEINNPLSAILSNVQNLLAIDRPASEMADLRIVEQETRRIARIVRNLLNFSSARSDEGEGTDMNYVVAELLELVRFSIKNESQVNIETELEGNLPRAAIGADEFKQVTLNLVKNSLQAIGKNGTILLRSRLCNDRLEFSVQDSGCGIKPDLLQRIFDPFFTTKAVDGNTGLGLSVVYGIVTKCGGSVAVESEDGRGTTIRVELPILDFKGRYGSRT